MNTAHRTLFQCALTFILLGPVYGLILEDCSLNGKDINLDNGDSTRGITGTVHCKDRTTGQTTRDIPYVKGQTDGILKDYRWGTKEFSEYKNGQPTQRSQKWDQKGRLVVNTLSDAKEQHAVNKAYYPNGALMRETLTQPGTTTKLHLEYYSDGHLAQVRCDNGPVGRKDCGYGDKTGELKTYYKNGKLKKIMRFAHGLGDGITETHFDSNGKIGRTEMWVAGVQEGPSEEFWENGRLMTQRTYKNGKTTGSLKKFFEEGGLAEESVTENGVVQQEKTYYQNGHPKTETVRRDGTVTVKEFWDSGKPEFTGTFTEKTRYGKTGEIIVMEPWDTLSEGTIEYNPWGGDAIAWKDVVEQGVHTHYREEGPLADETTYKDGQRDGLSRSYYPDRKVAVEAIYKEDHLVSKKEYDENGKLTSNETYYADGSRKSL